MKTHMRADRKLLAWISTTCTALLLAWSGPGSAATLAGQTFDDSVRISQSSLQLNGLGLRGVLFIRGYVAGLYLPKRASSYEEVAAMPGPKRVQMRMMLNVGPQEFIKAMTGGIRENSSPEEFATLKDRVDRMEQAIQAFGSTASGDTINFDYLPETGTTLTVNGVSKSAPIAGADFYNAVLKIFIGEHPVDGRLKNGLLGR
jgi:hypothetical protein